MHTSKQFTTKMTTCCKLINIIEQKINQVQHEINKNEQNSKTICTFSSTNISDNPNTKTIPSNIFT